MFPSINNAEIKYEVAISCTSRASNQVAKIAGFVMGALGVTALAAFVTHHILHLSTLLKDTFLIGGGTTLATSSGYLLYQLIKHLRYKSKVENYLFKNSSRLFTGYGRDQNQPFLLKLETMETSVVFYNDECKRVEFFENNSRAEKTHKNLTSKPGEDDGYRS